MDHSNKHFTTELRGFLMPMQGTAAERKLQRDFKRAVVQMRVKEAEVRNRHLGAVWGLIPERPSSPPSKTNH